MQSKFATLFSALAFAGLSLAAPGANSAGPNLGLVTDDAQVKALCDKGSASASALGNKNPRACLSLGEPLEKHIIKSKTKKLNGFIDGSGISKYSSV